MRGNIISSSSEFRYYQRADLGICASIAVEAFPLHAGRFSGAEAGKFMQAQIDGCHAISNYYELATVDGEVAGLLFGQVKQRFILIGVCQALKRLFLIFGRFLLGKYGRRRKLLGLIKPCLESWSVLQRNMPVSEAKVVLFAVARRYQGKGIGRALMDRFVEYALRHKAKSVCVPTDESASFWFYERYGFTRQAEYLDPLESYLANKPIKGFIYQLVLDKAEGRE